MTAIQNDADQPTPSAHAFMLRLWLEDIGGGRSDWRGRVQHVNSGEVRYFRDWQTLQTFVENLVDQKNPQGNDADRIK